MSFFSFLKYTFIIFEAHQHAVAHHLRITGLENEAAQMWDMEVI
jgi:hypothetical protein